MSDFSVRSDTVDVEQIMRQIRARIREKRGVDYTEEEIRELANVKLEKFLDPQAACAPNLLEEYRRVSTPRAAGAELRVRRRRRSTKRTAARSAGCATLLRPFLKLLFNPNPLIQALHIQAELNQKRPSATPSASSWTRSTTRSSTTSSSS